MSSAQSTRNRLNSLKLLTEELKDRTRNAPLDLSHIKQLLVNTRQLHTSRSHKPPVADQGMPLDQYMGNDLSYKPLFSDAKEPSRNQLQFQEEVVKLREENIQLEQKISSLRDDINRLEDQKGKLEKNQQTTNTNYFKLSESLQGFIGRLDIPGDKFDRLEYSAYDIELRLDKLILIKKERSSMQEFQLSTLKDAEYCGETVMVLRFEEFLDESQKNLTNVFIKFYSAEHLHKWDLAIYSNYHIVNSIHETNLFQKYFKGVKLERETQEQLQKMKKIRESGELDQSKEKDLLKLLIQKREEYLDVKKIFNEKLEHKIKKNVALNKEEMDLFQSKMEISDQSGKKDPQKNENTLKIELNKPIPNASSPIERIDQLEPHQEESQEINQPLSMQNNRNNPLHIKHTQSNLMDDRESNISRNFNQDQRFSNLSQFNIDRTQNSQIQGNFPLNPPPLIPGATTNQQLRESKATIVNQLSAVDGRTKSYESSSRNNSMTKFKDANQERLNNARMKLQNGYYATKYSKDGFSPHQKKVFLSLDCRKLCWSQRDNQSEYKSVPIAVLIKAEYGVLGQGIAKHVKNPDPRYFCVIEYFTSDYKKKTIELGSGNMQDIIDFSNEMQAILQNRTVLPN